MGTSGPNRSQRQECWETSRHCLANIFLLPPRDLKKTTTGRLCPIMCPVLNFQRATMHSTTLCFSGNQATRCNLGTTWRVENMTQKPLAFHLGLFDFSPYSPFFHKGHHPPLPRSLFGPKPSPRPRSTADGCQSVLSGSLLL